MFVAVIAFAAFASAIPSSFKLSMLEDEDSQVTVVDSRFDGFRPSNWPCTAPLEDIFPLGMNSTYPCEKFRCSTDCIPRYPRPERGVQRHLYYECRYFSPIRDMPQLEDIDLLDLIPRLDCSRPITMDAYVNFHVIRVLSGGCTYTLEVYAGNDALNVVYDWKVTQEHCPDSYPISSKEEDEEEEEPVNHCSLNHNCKICSYANGTNDQGGPCSDLVCQDAGMYDSYRVANGQVSCDNMPPSYCRMPSHETDNRACWAPVMYWFEELTLAEATAPEIATFKKRTSFTATSYLRWYYFEAEVYTACACRKQDTGMVSDSCLCGFRGRPDSINAKGYYPIVAGWSSKCYEDGYCLAIVPTGTIETATSPFPAFDCPVHGDFSVRAKDGVCLHHADDLHSKIRKFVVNCIVMDSDIDITSEKDNVVFCDFGVTQVQPHHKTRILDDLYRVEFPMHTSVPYSDPKFVSGRPALPLTGQNLAAFETYTWDSTSRLVNFSKSSSFALMDVHPGTKRSSFIAEGGDFHVRASRSQAFYEPFSVKGEIAVHGAHHFNGAWHSMAAFGVEPEYTIKSPVCDSYYCKAVGYVDSLTRGTAFVRGLDTIYFSAKVVDSQLMFCRVITLVLAAPGMVGVLLIFVVAFFNDPRKGRWPQRTALIRLLLIPVTIYLVILSYAVRALVATWKYIRYRKRARRNPGPQWAVRVPEWALLGPHFRTFHIDVRANLIKPKSS